MREHLPGPVPDQYPGSEGKRQDSGVGRVPCVSVKAPGIAEGALTSGGPFRAVLSQDKGAHGPVPGWGLLWEGHAVGEGLSFTEAIPKGRLSAPSSWGGQAFTQRESRWHFTVTPEGRKEYGARLGRAMTTG